MAVEQFEQQISLSVVRSPFLRGITGPGSIGEPKSRNGGGEEDEDDGPRKSIGNGKGGYTSFTAQPNSATTYIPVTATANQVRPPPITATASGMPAMMGPVQRAPYTPNAGPSRPTNQPSAVGQPPAATTTMSTGASVMRSSAAGSHEVAVREQLPAETSEQSSVFPLTSATAAKGQV